MQAGAVDRRWTGKVRAVPPVMVLREKSGSRLSFQFRSLLWGSVTILVAGLLCLLAWKMTYRQDVPLLVRIFIYMLAVAFTWSAVWSVSSRRSLEIDFIRKVVLLREKTLFSEKTRADGFDRFARITVGRHSLKSANYAIQLEYRDGWIEYLGWNEFGAMSLASAMELVNMIAPKMGIEINAPTYFEEKPLKGDR